MAGAVWEGEGIGGIRGGIYTFAMAKKAQIVDETERDDVHVESRSLPDGRREVTIRRPGRTIVLNAHEAWPDEFFRLVGSVEGEIERPPQTPVTELEDPFA